jgi:hypothetical protein
MLLLSLLAAPLLLTFTIPVAATCSSTPQQYNAIPNFTAGCIPSGYFQAQDLGNTSPTDMTTRCEQACTTNQFGPSCEAWVGELWKAADSGLYSGQCFYYGPSSVPTAPQQCADHPTELIAERKDHSLQCFQSSASAATAFCSRFVAPFVFRFRVRKLKDNAATSPSPPLPVTLVLFTPSSLRPLSRSIRKRPPRFL